jgi:DNA-binding XRE family transcriptional regulator
MLRLSKMETDDVELAVALGMGVLLPGVRPCSALQSPGGAAFLYCTEKRHSLRIAKSILFRYSFGVEETGLTPEQCRAARALLDWSQDDLSEKANIGTKTLQLFERAQRDPYARTITALRATLEKAGVEFIPENGAGPGVRLAKKKGKR